MGLHLTAWRVQLNEGRDRGLHRPRSRAPRHAARGRQRDPPRYGRLGREPHRPTLLRRALERHERGHVGAAVREAHARRAAGSRRRHRGPRSPAGSGPRPARGSPRCRPRGSAAAGGPAPAARGDGSAERCPSCPPAPSPRAHGRAEARVELEQHVAREHRLAGEGLVDPGRARAPASRRPRAAPGRPGSARSSPGSSRRPTGSRRPTRAAGARRSDAMSSKLKAPRR